MVSTRGCKKWLTSSPTPTATSTSSRKGKKAVAESDDILSSIKWEEKCNNRGPNRTDLLIEWFFEHPQERILLFSDSTEQAKADNRSKLTGKHPKSYWYTLIAKDLFTRDYDPKYRTWYGEDPLKFMKSVENRIDRLRKLYKEINSKIKGTGFSVRYEDTGAPLKSAINAATEDFPYYKMLHNFWFSLPSLHPGGSLSEAGKDYTDDACSFLQRTSVGTTQPSETTPASESLTTANISTTSDIFPLASSSLLNSEVAASSGMAGLLDGGQSALPSLSVEDHNHQDPANPPGLHNPFIHNNPFFLPGNLFNNFPVADTHGSVTLLGPASDQLPSQSIQHMAQNLQATYDIRGTDDLYCFDANPDILSSPVSSSFLMPSRTSSSVGPSVSQVGSRASPTLHHVLGSLTMKTPTHGRYAGDTPITSFSSTPSEVSSVGSKSGTSKGKKRTIADRAQQAVADSDTLKCQLLNSLCKDDEMKHRRLDHESAKYHMHHEHRIKEKEVELARELTRQKEQQIKEMHLHIELECAKTANIKAKAKLRHSRSSQDEQPSTPSPPLSHTSTVSAGGSP